VADRERDRLFRNSRGGGRGRTAGVGNICVGSVVPCIAGRIPGWFCQTCRVYPATSRFVVGQPGTGEEKCCLFVVLGQAQDRVRPSCLSASVFPAGYWCIASNVLPKKETAAARAKSRRAALPTRPERRCVRGYRKGRCKASSDARKRPRVTGQDARCDLFFSSEPDGQLQTAGLASTAESVRHDWGLSPQEGSQCSAGPPSAKSGLRS
jgi:hypothetical protein